MDSQPESSPFDPPQTPPELPEPVSPMIRAARFLGVDRAVLFVVVGRFWQLATGPVTQVLIAIWFTPPVRDFYAAFNTMLGLQVFVELGLHAVLINLASREWAELQLENGHVSGDEAARRRLSALVQLTQKWYLAIACMFILLLFAAGGLFFESDTVTRGEWVFPWMTLVLLQGGLLALLPKTSILEGCHQIVPVYRIRFWQGVAGTLIVWGLISAQLGLWSLVGSTAVRFAGEFWIVRFRFRSFFNSLPRLSVAEPGQPPAVPPLNWQTEVLPLQWRTAILGIMTWGTSQMPVLILFRAFPDSGEAGRLGMTWTVLTAFQSATMALVETRRPLFGSLIAKHSFAELNRLFARLARNAILALAAAAGGFTLAIWLIGYRSEWLAVRISDHFLPAAPTAMFTVAFIAYQAVMCMGIYVRAHRIEPFLIPSVVSGVAIIALEFVLGIRFASLGVSIGYAFGMALLMLPSYAWIWSRIRQSQ